MSLHRRCALARLRNRRTALLDKLRCGVIGEDMAEHVRQHYRMGQHTVLSRVCTCNLAQPVAGTAQGDVRIRDLISVSLGLPTRSPQITSQISRWSVNGAQVAVCITRPPPDLRPSGKLHDTGPLCALFGISPIGGSANPVGW